MKTHKPAGCTTFMIRYITAAWFWKMTLFPKTRIWPWWHPAQSPNGKVPKHGEHVQNCNPDSWKIYLPEFLPNIFPETRITRGSARFTNTSGKTKIADFPRSD